MQKQFEKMLPREKSAYSLSIRVYIPQKTTFRFVFLPHNINVRENAFFRARAEKGIALHIDASRVVWTLIYHGKLANQIARLAVIVVKISFFGWTR